MKVRLFLRPEDIHFNDGVILHMGYQRSALKSNVQVFYYKVLVCQERDKVGIARGGVFPSSCFHRTPGRSVEEGGMAEAGASSWRSLAMMDGCRAHTEEGCIATVVAVIDSRTVVSNAAAAAVSVKIGSGRMRQRAKAAWDLGANCAWAPLEARPGRTTKGIGEEQDLKATEVATEVDFADDCMKPS